MQLRDYQLQKMVIPAREALRESNSVVVVGATGSGKTSCAAYMAKGAVNKGKRVLIIVHKQEILGQMLAAMYDWGVKTGQIASGKTMTHELCQVAMVGTLINRLDRLPYSFDLVIGDEGHHWSEDNLWGKCRNHKKIKDAILILLTATPQGRTNGRGLGHFAKKIVQGVQTAELVKQGWLCYPRVYKPTQEIADKFKITRGDYDKSQQEEVFTRKQIVGDAIEHYRQYLDGLPTIVGCVSLQHAAEMEKQYQDYSKGAGKEWTTAFIQGGNKYETQRRDALQGLASGSVQLVFFVDVLGEGVDVPACTGIQLLRKTTSLVLYLQFIGRILRPVWPENFNQYNSTPEQRLQAIRRSPKPYAVVLDHAGNYYTHGHPIVPRKWGLEDTDTGRKVEQSAPQITTCPDCNAIWPGVIKICPACGCEIKEAKDNSRRNPDVIKAMLQEAGDFDDLDLDKMASFVGGLDKMSSEEQRKKMLGALRYMEKDKVKAIGSTIGYKKNWTDTMYHRLGIGRK